MNGIKHAVLDPKFVSAAKFDQEPDWLSEMRNQAFEKSQDLPLPVFAKVNYSSWPLLEFSTKKQADLEIPKSVKDQLADYTFVNLGNRNIKNELANFLSQGVILCSMADAIKNYGDLVQKYLYQFAIDPNEDRLTAINLALMNNGTFLYVPDNVQLKDPIKLLTIQDSRQEEMFIDHTLIVAGKNSRFNVFQRTETIGDIANPAHLTAEIIADQDSHVQYNSLDCLGPKTYAYFNRKGHLKEDARIDWAMGIFNNGSTIADFDSDLYGVGSHTEMQTVAISTGRQTQGLDTQVTNYGRHTEGNILQIGVLLDSSTLIFNGIGKIIHGAHGSKAQQENRILMLSPKAHGDANPILLIDENDVIAGHAASVGQINKKQLYYLMSRGLSKEVAQRLVVRGFLGVVLSNVPIPAVREQMVAMIERKLQNDPESK